MGQNIFTYENVSPYRRSGTNTYVGEWVQRNGEWAMQIAPSPFYTSPNYHHVLENEFKPNTRYVFDIWFDTDDVIYNGNNVAGGFVIYTPSGTRIDSGQFAVAHTTGFKHVRFVTPSGTSVGYIGIYYYTSIPVYYRWDSYIVPYDTQKLAHTGQGIVSHLAEGASPCVFTSGGGINANEVIEF